MEVVTLGAVGDSCCGKSQLLLSYTGNCVRKVYVPTALDCMWTTLMMDGEVIDLRIWDNTGLDDAEYNKLRPLSYPQTEVFLVCFSLKSRLSLLNTETRWIPEIRHHNKDTPFLLVGCKRDDCLKSSLESLDDVVSYEEGNEFAERLGAVGYVETSAIEQSGLTECFNTAIKTALSRRGKHCEDAIPTLTNGNYTSITFPYTNGVYTFGMNVTYKCDVGYEFTDGSSTDVIYCNHSNKWTEITRTCALISCPEFNVSNGNVSYSSLEYQGVATVTCNPGFYTENNLGSMSVTCQADKTWTMVPSCEVHNLRKQSKRFSFQPDTVRDATNVFSEAEVRSSLDCAALCTEHYQCLEANYKDESAGGVCRLFSDNADQGDMSSEPGWHYMIKDVN